MTNNPNKEKLLIVGGTGFIGTHIATEALSLGFQVSIISKNNKPLSDRFSDIEYLSIDISIKKDLCNQLKKRIFHYVINLGGYIDHSNYSNGGDKVFDIHFNGTRNLVDCLNKKDLKSFIQIGSSDEYGNNDAPQNENQRELPISPYSFAKASATHFLQMLYRTEKFPVVVLRPFLVYGPGQDQSRFIPQIIQGCLHDKKFSVSKGEQLRDFCFIDDIVNVVFKSLNNTVAYGEVINIASGEPITIKDVIINIQNIIGMGKPQFGRVSYRTGENMELYADTIKAKKLLNWQSNVDIEQGLKATIDSMREMQ